MPGPTPDDNPAEAWAAVAVMALIAVAVPVGTMWARRRASRRTRDVAQ